MTNESKSPENSSRDVTTLRRILPQIIAVTVKNSLLLAYGMTIGFPTILIPNLSGGNPKEKIVLGTEAISWIGSANFLVVPLGCLFSGIATQPIGRRKAMQIFTLPFLASWLLFHFASHSWEVFFALCLTGLTGGLLEAPTLTYLAEVTTPNLRGVLASTSTVAIIAGILIEFLLGTFMDWRTVALVSCIVPILSCVCLFFVPESPYWLISKNRFEEAQKSTAWLRGWLEIEEVEHEFKELCEQLKKSGTSRNTFSAENRGFIEKLKKAKQNLTMYTKKPFLWPFSLVSLTFALGHFSGMTTLQTYAVNIFATLKAPIDKYYATIILGIAEALGCILSSMLVHFVGKRKMNFLSLLGTGICFFIVATYAHLINVNSLKIVTKDENLDVEGQSWLPLTFLVGAAFFTHCGIRILPWMLIGEVYYSKIRATASGFSGAMSYIFGFLANKIFFSMISALTLPGTFWLYSAVCMLGLLLLYFLLPETEGKTLYEITEHFAGRNKLNNKVHNFVRVKTNREKQLDNGVDNKAFDEDSSHEINTKF
ncbi:facilitated trehalose transporter Tret1-like [Sitophilus oryzae]|uniref:Facilitated trehalose transporter Tret1-like n=1 Tax=Sitophilus oryzae TaxID=7048 RepID=A0A6J2YU31_SITOR|nr:facilitated trehalose transporter Tret1-like [Sitophilus oryzae]XP_030766691.1 facilitated trehalose transporter Tret1-like [Sitophilus oryzae]